MIPSDLGTAVAKLYELNFAYFSIALEEKPM